MNSPGILEKLVAARIINSMDFRQDFFWIDPEKNDSYGFAVVLDFTASYYKLQQLTALIYCNLL